MNAHRLQRTAGVTLIELMVVVAVITVLAAIGYPSYTQYVTSSKRAVAQGFLSQIADRQEQFFLDNKRYAANLAELGFNANTIGITDEGMAVANNDANRIYVMRLTNVTATSYTANAVPELVQAARDVRCGTLNLNNLGQKGHTGPGGDCW